MKQARSHKAIFWEPVVIPCVTLPDNALHKIEEVIRKRRSVGFVFPLYDFLSYKQTRERTTLT